MVAGIALAAVAWLFFSLFLAFREGPFPWFLVSYNIPITVAFAGLGMHHAWTAIRLGLPQFVASHAPLGGVWLMGAGVLFLRLVAQSIDVSGHMVWSIMMGVQCITQRLPLWFSIAVWAVGLQVLILKFFVLGGYSGQKGIAVGALLGFAVWLATRGREELRFGARADGLRPCEKSPR